MPRGARPDLTIDGTIELERLNDVIFVGRPAFGQENNTVGIFRLVSGSSDAVRTPVKLGRSSVNSIEILSGLQPGDQVLLYTDGVTEARSPDGDFFGVQRLVDLIIRHNSSGLPAPETMRRVVRSLLEHQQGQLNDDATLMLVQYRSGTQERLLP